MNTTVLGAVMLALGGQPARWAVFEQVAPRIYANRITIGFTLSAAGTADGVVGALAGCPWGEGPFGDGAAQEYAAGDIIEYQRGRLLVTVPGGAAALVSAALWAAL